MFSKKSVLALLLGCTVIVPATQAFAISRMPDLTATVAEASATNPNQFDVKVVNLGSAAATSGYAQIRFYGDNAQAQALDIPVATSGNVSFNMIGAGKSRWLEASLPWMQLAKLTGIKGPTFYFKVVVVAMPGAGINSHDFSVTR